MVIGGSFVLVVIAAGLVAMLLVAVPTLLQLHMSGGQQTFAHAAHKEGSLCKIHQTL